MKLKFYNKRFIFFGISIALILIGFVASIILGVNLDIQFKGGSVIVYSYEGEISINELTNDAQEATDLSISKIQNNYNSALDMKSISINIAGEDTISVAQKTSLDKLLYEDERYSANKFSFEEELTVDPSIAKEYLMKGVWALLLASVLIVLFVWYRFRVMSGPSAGVMSLVALLHDILIVFFAFVVLKIPLNENFIAVMLAIIGYSINDTIVIYDRIRENVKLEQKAMPLSDLVDKSMSQSMNRTINTSVSTFGAMLITYIFAYINGIESVQHFALPMMVGIVTGFYSSMFIASPLWVLWETRGGRSGY